VKVYDTGDFPIGFMSVVAAISGSLLLLIYPMVVRLAASIMRPLTFTFTLVSSVLLTSCG